MTDFTLKPHMHLHLVGIGGAGMSAIARVLLGRGFVVSGSDRQANEYTAVLQQAGATVYQGHQAGQIAGADVVVISSAVPPDNPEVMAAQAQGIPVLKRADLLGHLMGNSIGIGIGIAIAGTHGKTTTTGMVAQILLHAGLGPTVILGGTLPTLGTNGRAGQGDYFVVEADEYDYMFLGLRPEVIVLTNLEHDHPDIFVTAADYEDAFCRFVRLLPENGRLIACIDDPGVTKLLAGLDLPNVEITSYGLAESAQFSALDLRPNHLGGSDFLVKYESEILGLARLRLPGRHNVSNALAAIIVALDAGVDFGDIREALAGFGGVGRRFQLVGKLGDVTVIDDYAHHPTEIRATLAAARQRYPGRRLWAVWQPHTFSRTKLYLQGFAASFGDADKVVALDIYRSRETETLGMDTAVVLNAMNHPDAIYIPGRREAADYILERIRPGDVVLTLGAGDGDAVGRWVLEGLKEKVI
ncbi:MAG: UDP-N-acetylmuramate--L-alanine ligase [Anaerolineae bacterium]